MAPCLPNVSGAGGKRICLMTCMNINRNLYQILLVTGVELYLNIINEIHCVEIDIIYVHSTTEKVIKINSKFVTKGDCTNLLEIYVKTFLDAIRNARVFLTGKIYQMFSPISIKYNVSRK